MTYATRLDTAIMDSMAGHVDDDDDGRYFIQSVNGDHHNQDRTELMIPRIADSTQDFFLSR